MIQRFKGQTTVSPKENRSGIPQIGDENPAVVQTLDYRRSGTPDRRRPRLSTNGLVDGFKSLAYFFRHAHVAPIRVQHAEQSRKRAAKTVRDFRPSVTVEHGIHTPVVRSTGQTGIFHGVPTTLHFANASASLASIPISILRVKRRFHPTKQVLPFSFFCSRLDFSLLSLVRTVFQLLPPTPISFASKKMRFFRSVQPESPFFSP